MPSITKSTYGTLTITAIRQEVVNVKTFVLVPSVLYTAGQFLTFAINHHGKEERRSFSISSSPELSEPLAITIKRVDNGVYSRLLIDKAKEGDVLYTTGAAGLFTLPEDISTYKQVFFFAAGIGITPIFSLLKTILYSEQEVNVVLIYSNRNIEETVFYKELNQLLNKFPSRFKIEFLFSSTFDLNRARLNKQLLPALLSEYAITSRENILFYTCGPFSYMRMVIYSLEEQGIPANNIKKENFNTEIKPIIKVEPPDKLPHNVIIKMNGEERSFISQYPDNILQAAKKNGIALPYSCETGRCGSCALLCTKGKVWMSNNEVLTDQDISKQLILSCVGYPVYSDIELILK